MNMFLNTYKELREEQPEVPASVTFRSVCQTIINFGGTFDDIKVLNAYYEQELEEEIKQDKGVFN